jgi:hypothetical protein
VVYEFKVFAYNSIGDSDLSVRSTPLLIQQVSVRSYTSFSFSCLTLHAGKQSSRQFPEPSSISDLKCDDANSLAHLGHGHLAAHDRYTPTHRQRDEHNRQIFLEANVYQQTLQIAPNTMYDRSTKVCSIASSDLPSQV